MVQALTDQANIVALTSRAFSTDVLGEYEEYATKLVGCDKLAPVDTGKMMQL